jgi:hypothetical protein
MGLLLIVLAAIYGSLYYFTLTKPRNQKDSFGLISLAIAIALASVAVPVQFELHIWTTLVWSLEIPLLMWSVLRFSLPVLRVFSYLIFGLVTGYLLFFKATMESANFTIFLNERFLSFVIGICAIYLTAYLLWKKREALTNWKRPFKAFLINANFLTLFILSLEIWSFFDHLTGNNRGPQLLSLTGVWAVYGVGLLAIGIWKRVRLVRLLSLILILITILKVFVYDVWFLEQIYRVIAFIGLGILLIVSGYFYQRFRKNIRNFIR